MTHDPAHHDPAHHDHHHRPEDDAALADLLDLDAEVLHDLLAEVTGQAARTLDGPARHLLDLGAGTGAGTFALLRRFPDATVTALDASATMLHRVRGRAAALGVAERVRTVEADLDAGWPDLGGESADLVWAAASLHHVADPDRVLRDVHDALRPGGVLVLVEMGSWPRFLPEGPEAELEERVHAARAAVQAVALPAFGADWAPHLLAAGFSLEVDRVVAVDLTAPPGAGRYAWSSLRRVGAALQDRLGPQDVAALAELSAEDGPRSLLHRTDLRVRASRTLHVARRG